MKIVAISDTHGRARNSLIPDGDILVHAGDLSMSGSEREIMEELEWLATFPHEHKLVTPGNHDRWAESRPFSFLVAAGQMDITVLSDDGTKIKGVNFWGCPWTPRFGVGWAYNADPGEFMMQYLSLIPSSTDVLITHGPPAVFLGYNFFGEDCGSVDLKREVIERVKPKLHIFGHIHEAAGLRHHPVLPIQFANVSLVDLNYNPTNPARVFDL